MSRGTMSHYVRIWLQKDKKQLFIAACKLAIQLAILYLVVIFLDSETYVFQSTTLGSILRPVVRKSCTIPSNTIKVRSALRHRQLDQQGREASNASKISVYPMKASKYKISLLYIYGDSDGTWGADLMNRVIHNREVYCKRHGYGLINANQHLDRSRPVAWSKLIAMERSLQSLDYDYVFYIDMDVVIMDMTKPLESFVDVAGTSKDFIMTSDWSGVNTGLWLAHKSEFSLWFLRTAWSMSHLVQKTSANGKPHPFEYEQRAFHFLLDTEVWRKRGLPTYRPQNTTVTEIRSHFTLLPQCAFNSYLMHPLEFRGNREESHYIEGDFVIHFAGKKGKKKVDLMDHYLKIAEKTYGDGGK